MRPNTCYMSSALSRLGSLRAMCLARYPGLAEHFVYSVFLQPITIRRKQNDKTSVRPPQVLKRSRDSPTAMSLSGEACFKGPPDVPIRGGWRFPMARAPRPTELSISVSSISGRIWQAGSRVTLWLLAKPERCWAQALGARYFQTLRRLCSADVVGRSGRINFCACFDAKSWGGGSRGDYINSVDNNACATPCGFAL